MAAPDLQIQLQAELDSEFQIVRLVGEGSVAQVYLARELALQRLVVEGAHPMSGRDVVMVDLRG